MKKISILLLAICFVFSCKSEKSEPEFVIGDFSFSSEYITQDKPFTITYTGSESVEEGLFFNLMHSKELPQDLIFEDDVASITIPDSISAVAFVPKVNGKYLSNDGQGFLFKVKDFYGKDILDSEAALQYFSFNTGQDYGLDSDPKAVLKSIEDVLEKDKSLEDDWYRYHLYIARQIDKETTEGVSKRYLSELESKADKTIEDYDKLSNIYYAIRASEKGDSLSKIGAEKFPDSKLADNAARRAFFEAITFEERDSVFNLHKDKLLKTQNASYILQTMARSNYNKGNMEAFESFANMVEDRPSVASMYNSIAWPKAEKGEDLEMAMELSKKSLDLIKEEQSDLANKPDFYSPNQYRNNLEYTYCMYADTYALLAFKSGNLKDAITYQEEALEKGASAEMYERYVEFLMADEQFETVSEKAPEMIENGNSTAKLKDYLKTAYAKTNPEGDVDAMIADLEEKAKQNELQKLRDSLLDDEAPDFTLTNLDGEQYTLSELQGKTVVLDFWATWCGPCIASFPAMQEVVNKYEDDEKVEIFFVDTFEDGEDRLDEVQGFITDNKYTFNVLIDPVPEGSTQHLVAQQYKVTGIPTKIIIGPNGKIKFKSVGFNGSAEKTVNEIDAMIELINSAP